MPAPIQAPTSCVFLTLAEYRDVSRALKALSITSLTSDAKILDRRRVLAEKIDEKVSELAARATRANRANKKP